MMHRRPASPRFLLGLWLATALSGGCGSDAARVAPIADAASDVAASDAPAVAAPAIDAAPADRAPTVDLAPPADAGDPWIDGDHEFRVVPVVTGLAHPWALAILPDGDMLVTERAGRLRLVRGGALQAEPVPGVPPVIAAGQGGLLDLALAPDFATSRRLYFSYAKPLGPSEFTTAVARARFEGDRLHDVADVLVTAARNGATHHFGSRLAFDREGLLYVTIGDRGEMDKAQELSNHHGKTLRLRPDGQAAGGNPLAAQPGALPEIFTYGLRNAQGMAVHPLTGAVWVNEHGPMGGDEVNALAPGANFGWPRTTYGENYGGGAITPHKELPGVEPPVLYWAPSIAPSGMVFYTGHRFPRWRGNAFVGALAGTHLRRVVLDGTRVVRQQALAASMGGRVRDVRQGPDGLLYLLTDEPSGALLRIEPMP